MIPAVSGVRARDRWERELFRRVAAGDRGARDELTQRFLPLARSLAARYRGESREDLLQVASLALIKAIDRFEFGRGVAFSSFAVPTILGEIRRYFRDRTWAVRVPCGLQELSLRVDRAVGDLAQELGCEPSVKQIAAAIDAPEDEVLEALQAGDAHFALSFDAPCDLGDEGFATLGDSVAVQEDGYDRADERAMLAALLQMVSVREREVLRMRFEHDMTQAEIARNIGVSQMQVSRIIRQALQRLRAVADQQPHRAAGRATRATYA